MAKDTEVMKSAKQKYPRYGRPVIHVRVISISTQEPVSVIEQLPLHHDWIFEFKKKYGMV